MKNRKSQVTDVIWRTATLTRQDRDRHSDWGRMVRSSQKQWWDAGLKKPMLDPSAFKKSLKKFKGNFVSKICLNRKWDDRHFGAFSVVFQLHISWFSAFPWIKGHWPPVSDHNHVETGSVNSYSKLQQCILAWISCGLSRKTGNIKFFLVWERMEVYWRGFEMLRKMNLPNQLCC